MTPVRNFSDNLRPSPGVSSVWKLERFFGNRDFELVGSETLRNDFSSTVASTKVAGIAKLGGTTACLELGRSGRAGPWQ